MLYEAASQSDIGSCCKLHHYRITWRVPWGPLEFTRFAFLDTREAAHIILTTLERAHLFKDDWIPGARGLHPTISLGDRGGHRLRYPYPLGTTRRFSWGTEVVTELTILGTLKGIPKNWKSMIIFVSGCETFWNIAVLRRVEMRLFGTSKIKIKIHDNFHEWKWDFLEHCCFTMVPAKCSKKSHIHSRK